MKKNQLLQINIQSFWVFLLLLIGTMQNNFAQTYSSNGQGTYESGDHDGFFWSFWSEGSGQVTMTLGPDGNYSTNWTNIQNFTAGKGWRVGSRDKVICFEGSYDGGSNGFLAVYGWTEDPLIEYYVVEDHGQWRPPGNTSDIESFGTVESDGGVYDIYRSRRVDKPSIIGNATFYQFWSVRRTKRSSGTVTFENHVDAWEATGLQLGTTWDYMIMESEGFGSSGSSNITVWECVTCDTPEPTVTAQVNYELGDTPAQLTANGTNLAWYTSAAGGTPLPQAPTPSTATTGTTTYYVSQTLNGCEGPRASITVNVTYTYKMYKTSVTPLLDGETETLWQDPNIEAISAEKVLTGTVSNDADLSGTVKFLWDDVNVYFFAEITDNAKQNDSENSYEDDAIEIYFDADNSKATSYDANDVQYSFGWDDGTVVGSLPDGRSVANIEYAVTETATGYNVEGSIPWATMQGSPQEGNLIGIDFMINDDDDGTGRDKKLSWNAGADDAWENPSLFGQAVLSGGGIVTDLINNKQQGLSVFPNPTNSKVHFNKNYDWKLYNAYGILLETGNSDELQLSSYSSGMYLIMIDNQVVQIIKE